MSPAAAAPTPSRLYRGVSREPDGRWAAYVTDGELEGRLIGHFDREPLAALAHDRVAVALGAPLAHGRVNFPPSFSGMELLFLRRVAGPGFVLRVVAAGDAYDEAFEAFLAAEFDRYLGSGDGACREETTRAVAEFAAREGPRWRRGAADSAHVFVFGHINPVFCSSWVERFHQGDPDRSYFNCREAHELEELEAARRRAELLRSVEEEPPRPPPLESSPPVKPQGPSAVDDAEEERPPDSPPVKPGRESPPWWRSLKRRLRRACFDAQGDLQIPLLQLV